MEKVAKTKSKQGKKIIISARSKKIGSDTKYYIEAKDESGQIYDFGRTVVSFDSIRYQFYGSEKGKSDKYSSTKIAIEAALDLVNKNVNFTKFGR